MNKRVIVLCDECVWADSGYGDLYNIEPDSLPLGKIHEGYDISTLACAHGYECGSCDSPSSNPHFGRACDGCETKWAGNRYDYVLTWVGVSA